MGYFFRLLTQVTLCIWVTWMGLLVFDAFTHTPATEAGSATTERYGQIYERYNGLVFWAAAVGWLPSLMLFPAAALFHIAAEVSAIRELAQEKAVKP